MSHSPISNILSTPAHFLFVLVINQCTLNHHTLYHHTLNHQTLNHHTLTTLHQDTNTHLSKDITMDTHHLPSYHLLTVPTSAHFLLVLLINQRTLNHHTLHQEETYTHLKNTHQLPRSYDLIVHILPASHHTSTLELKCENQVTEVIFVPLHLCFHAKFWGKQKCMTLCTGL